MMRQKPKRFHLHSRHGFTLFLSVLVASLLLSVALALFNISVKELTFSSAARESQIAFYAADSGAECALYNDIKEDNFSIESPSPSIVCGGNSISVIIAGLTRTFSLDSASGDPYCATVVVTKEDEGGTSVESRGYNTCDIGNPRRVERGLRVTY